MDEQYQALASAGVIGVVCQAISTHMISPIAAATGCRVLLFLARNDDNQIKIAGQDGIDAILEAMRTHRSHAGVQEQGCRALLNVGWSRRDVQMQIKKSGAEGVVKSAMAASDAMAVTKKKGQQLLDRLGRV